MSTIVDLVLIWLSLIALYYFFMSVAATIPKRKKVYLPVGKYKVAIIIAAYKEDNVILKTATEAVNHKFSYGSHRVYVVADSLHQNTIADLEKSQVEVMPVKFNQRSKVKALNSALQQIDREYDIALILDADNIMEESFLDEIAKSFAQGYLAIQGQRRTKNENTQVAIFDSISERVNNHIFNKGPQFFNLSSRLVGSAMAFDYELLKRHLSDITAVGGFDKELELALAREKIHVHYCEKAKVLDEKVDSIRVYQLQRTRWIAAQFFHLRKHFFQFLFEVGLKMNVKYGVKYFEYSFPPRVFIPASFLIFALLGVKQTYILYTSLSMLTLLLIAILIPVVKSTKRRDIKVLFSAYPKILMATISIMGRLKRAHTNFIHTPHSHQHYA